MADSIYTFDPVAANNSTLDSIPYGPNQLYHNQIDNWFRSLAAKLAQFVDDLGAVNTVTGTDTIAVTLASGITTYATGQVFRFVAANTNTGAATMNVNGIGVKAIRKISGGTDVALVAGDIAAGVTYEVMYRASANSAAGAWVIVTAAAVATATTSQVGTVEQQFNTIYNIGLSASVGTNALTIALKDADGNDPSSSSPVIIPFRNVTAATGTPSYLTITAATSLVISSGSAMGFTSGAIGRLWVVGFNDGGTFRLGAVNCLSGTNIMALRNGIYSSTAEGGAGGADSAQVIYTGTAVTDKAMVILGYLEATEATAGTWATAPSLVKVLQPGDALPGDTIQSVRSATGASATGSTSVPFDNTIPQNTEGTQFMSQAITPRSAANVLEVSSLFIGAASAASQLVTSALFQDSTADALAATWQYVPANNAEVAVPMNHTLKAGTSSSTTFKVRAGANAGATVTFNGAASTQNYGGVLNSYLQIQEMVA